MSNLSDELETSDARAIRTPMLPSSRADATEAFEEPILGDAHWKRFSSRKAGAARDPRPSTTRKSCR